MNQYLIDNDRLEFVLTTKITAYRRKPTGIFLHRHEISMNYIHKVKKVREQARIFLHGHKEAVNIVQEVHKLVSTLGDQSDNQFDKLKINQVHYFCMQQIFIYLRAYFDNNFIKILKVDSRIYYHRTYC